MDEIKTNDIEVNAQPDQGEKSERLFTQAEVNEIVRKRIAKEKAKQPEQAAPAFDDAELTARANRLDCREFLLDNGLSPDLLDVIDTTDSKVFIDKVTKLQGMMPKVGSYPEVEDRGEVAHVSDPSEAIRAAFQNTAHKPKEW